MSASKSIRIVCRAYGSGTFNGLTFQEEVVDGSFAGVAETEDVSLVAWFEARPKAFRVFRPESEPAPEGLSALTVPLLRELAEEEGIDLAGASRKPEIVAAIEAARADRQDPSEDAEDDEGTSDDTPPEGDAPED